MIPGEVQCAYLDGVRRNGVSDKSARARKMLEELFLIPPDVLETLMEPLYRSLA